VQEWVDVGCIGCLSLAAHKSDIHPSKDPYAPVNFTLHFTQHIPVPMNLLSAKTLKLSIMGCHSVTMAMRGLMQQLSDSDNDYTMNANSYLLYA
jgi:hypothetical protein